MWRMPVATVDIVPLTPPGPASAGITRSSERHVASATVANRRETGRCFARRPLPVALMSLARQRARNSGVGTDPASASSLRTDCSSASMMESYSLISVSPSSFEPYTRKTRWAGKTLQRTVPTGIVLCGHAPRGRIESLLLTDQRPGRRRTITQFRENRGVALGAIDRTRWNPDVGWDYGSERSGLIGSPSGLIVTGLCGNRRWRQGDLQG